MKRLILSLMVMFSVIVFSGCGTKTTMDGAKANLSSAFECDMKIICEDTEFGGKLKKMGSGSWETEFFSPDTLDGVVLAFSGNDVTASYKGLAFTVPKKALPVKSVLLNLITAVDTLASEESLQGNVKDGVMTVKGELEAGEYELCIDEESGCIRSFEMKNLGTKMTFENVTFTALPPAAEENVQQLPETAPAVPEGNESDSAQ